jgi:hypothetical protein
MTNKKTIKRNKRSRNKKGGLFQFLNRTNNTCPKDIANLINYPVIKEKYESCCKSLFKSKKPESLQCITLDSKMKNYEENQKKIQSLDQKDKDKVKYIIDVQKLDNQIREIEKSKINEIQVNTVADDEDHENNENNENNDDDDKVLNYRDLKAQGIIRNPYINKNGNFITNGGKRRRTKKYFIKRSIGKRSIRKSKKR